jgi:hypothetical protein
MVRAFWAIALLLLLGCDKSGPLAELDAGNPWPNVSSLPNASAVQPSSATASAPPPTRVMPPRPVPTTNPTVLITMPEEVQLKAIQYMAAMQAPQPSDAPADPDYAKQIANQLKAVGQTDVVSSGRRIDILLEKGCDATLPRQALARHTGASLTTLLTRGVLVLRCADHQLQCLQSTRDTNDVLCTRK